MAFIDLLVIQNTNFTRYFVLDDKNAHLHGNWNNMFLPDILVISKPKYDCGD